MNLADPVIRNLQITQCYHELSAVLTGRTGSSANWCTFATWASKQAGQTIRKEDLERLLERRLRGERKARQAAERMAAAASERGATGTDSPQTLALEAHNFTPAIERASQAVSRGNRKVFEEIGREFARFFHECLPADTPNSDAIARFCEGLRPGDPPEGQRYLRQAFTHYYCSLFENDLKTRAELILLANLEIGFHEQTRLQPEIAESLDAGLLSSVGFTRRLIAGLFPYSSWVALAHLYARRLLGRPTTLDQAIRVLLAAAQVHLRQIITESMMTILLPSGVLLRLGSDLEVNFPASLQAVTNPELRALLESIDPTPDSPLDSGAVDWADLPERLHFIVELFRRYQEYPDLLTPPFTPGQVEAFKAGQLPEGRL